MNKKYLIAKKWNEKQTGVSVFLCLMLFPLPSFAYLDPGTGSMILQGIIGSIAVALATGKLWWYRVKGIFSSNKEATNDSDVVANDADSKNKD